MFFSHSHSSISLLSVLSVIIGVSKAATVPSTTISDLQTVDRNKSNQTSKVIVYGRTQDKVPIDLVCECVQFYLCDSEDVVILPTSHHDNGQNECQGEVEICCAIRNETSSSTTKPLAVNTFSSEEPNTAKIITYGRTDDGAFDLQCQCTVFYLCDEQDWITLPTTSEDQCLESDVCCKIKVESQPMLQDETWSINFNDTKRKVITYESIDGHERRDLQCRCTLFYECSLDDVVELPKTDKNQYQCSEGYVCCK